MKTFGFVSTKSAVGWVRKPSSSAMKRRRSRLFQLRKRPLDGCRDELRIFESAFACNEAAKRSASLDECRRGDQVSETCALSHHALKSPCPLYPRKEWDMIDGVPWKAARPRGV
jgi:hypothetical protein